MHIFFNIFGRQVPAYGLLIVLGAFIANVIGYFLVKHEKKSFDDFMLVEAYCILGGFLGAKILYLIVTFNDIEWNRIFEADYFNAVMKGGFVFYGGLIGGAAAATLLSYAFHFLLMLSFVWWKLRVSVFSAGQLKVIAMMVALALMELVWRNTVTPLVGHMIVDAVLKTAVLSIVAAAITYFWRISPTVNALVDKYLPKRGN